MARDPKTTFQQQSDLHSRRPANDEILKGLPGGQAKLALSYNMILKDDEALVAFALDDGTLVGVRLNPEIVLNLGINLLKVGKQFGWFDVNLQTTAAERPS